MSRPASSRRRSPARQYLHHLGLGQCRRRPQTSYGRIAETSYASGFYLGTDVSGTKYKMIVNNGSGATGSCGDALGCAVGGTVTTGWHLVTGTYDGTTARLYVDSTLVGSDTMVAPGATDLPLYIGRYFGAAVYGWNGAIDEPRLYNRALSAAEITTLYNAASATGGALVVFS